jgi:NitT/TauT family transport system permease protein
MTKTERLLLSLAGFLTLLTIWQLVTWAGIFPPGLLPSPLAVAAAIRELWVLGVLLRHIADSFYRFLAGYLLAVVLGVPFGLLAGWSRRLEAVVEPLLQILRPISPIAWLPLAILWFGIGNPPTIFIIFLAAFFPIVLSAIGGVKSVDPLLLRVAQNFGATPGQILGKVVVPAAFPYLAVGMHMALGAAWIFLVAGEMVGVRSGLGFLIIDGRNQVRYDLVMAAMVIIGALGLAIDRLMHAAELRLLGRFGTRRAGKDG